MAWSTLGGLVNMSSSDIHRSYPTIYSPLDRGDNELIGIQATTSPKEDSIKGSYSSDSTLNIITLFDSKLSSDESAGCVSNSRSEKQEIPLHLSNNPRNIWMTSCCVCQAAWGHFKTEVSRRGKNQQGSGATEEMERSCAVRANSEIVCRICLEERGIEGFISPCDCSGTMGNVHRSCLERWLTLLNSSECEICRHKFKVRRYMRPASEFQLAQLPLNVCGDLICITVLSPLCILIIYFTIDATVTNIRSGKTSGAVALILIATTIMVVYFIWVYFTLKQALSFWWGSNRIVRLSTNQVAPARGTLSG